MPCPCALGPAMSVPHWSPCHLLAPVSLPEDFLLQESAWLPCGESAFASCLQQPSINYWTAVPSSLGWDNFEASALHQSRSSPRGSRLHCGFGFDCLPVLLVSPPPLLYLQLSCIQSYLHLSLGSAPGRTSTTTLINDYFLMVLCKCTKYFFQPTLLC